MQIKKTGAFVRISREAQRELHLICLGYEKHGCFAEEPTVLDASLDSPAGSEKKRNEKDFRAPRLLSWSGIARTKKKYVRKKNERAGFISLEKYAAFSNSTRLLRLVLPQHLVGKIPIFPEGFTK